MTKSSFLQPDISQIRHQVRGILDSYSHDWDVLAELAQNAVDSIVAANPTRGHVTVRINATERTIEFSDNGTGIEPAELAKLLRPFSTNKMGAANQIGQKGVGLTFILFSSSHFEITTHHSAGSAKATVSGANAWLHSEDDSELLAEIHEVEPAAHGVTVRVKLANESHPAWTLTFEQVRFALRTRTALGNTAFIWGDPFNADVSLSHIDLSGNSREEEFDCRYLLPVEGLKSEDSISVDSYLEWRDEKDRSDQEKRRKLQNKIVFREGKKYQAGRDIRYWACFVPNRAVWRKLSAVWGLIDPTDDSDVVPQDEQFTGYNFSGGLYTSTKGMPTGIYLDLKPRGSAGYVPNFFILVEDPSLSFDIGRKAIQSRQQGMLRDVAYEQFREFINSSVKYMSGAIDDPDPTFDREELFEEIRELPDLDSAISAFTKRPNGQEATVAGLFFEQIGKGGFSGFQPWISGYKGRYDLYGKLGKKSCVVEFKFDLAGLFRDFSDEKKMFDEINAVVLWEVTERDRKIIANRGLTLSQIESGILSTASSKFPNAHYKLNIDGVRSIEIVCMKKIVKPDE